MWCHHCQKSVDLAPPAALEAYRGQVPLADLSGVSFCPDCGHRFSAPYAESPPTLDSWEERLEEELEEVRGLLEESRDLRASFTRVDTPAVQLEPEVPVTDPVTLLDPPTHPTAKMPRIRTGGLPRTPAVILFMLGVGLLSESWISGFEAIGTAGLSLDWIGQMILLCGGLLWLRDAMRSERAMSGKLDATIAGLHVLRKDIAAPPEPHDAHRQLADLKRRLSSIARTADLGSGT